MSDASAEEILPQDQASEGADARIAALETRLAEMKNEALRHLADAENTRKRAAREREETAKYAVAKFARDLLDVADNLQRALQAVPAGAAEQEAIKNLVAGVEATERQMAAIFERAGIRKIDPVGQAFDPNMHRVVSEIDGGAPGTVLQVLQVGYMIHDRLLREAMVVIAKGGTPARVNETV